MDLKPLNDLQLSVIPGAKLCDFTTFRLGGPCAALVECPRPQDVLNTVKVCRDHDLPFLLFGLGSNIVVSDEGLDIVVIRSVAPSPGIQTENDIVIASAASELDAVAAACVEKGLGGLNFATGIPGTVGGAVAGNAGAWGKDMSGVLAWAEILDSSGNVRKVARGDLGFSYRHSRIKDNGEIILRAAFALKPAYPADLARERANILKMRWDKHPDLEAFPCAGSFFRNLEPTSSAERRQAAGGFLEDAGAKAMSVGGAKVFPKHANIITKSEGCTSQDVYDLSRTMAAAVKEKYGFDLKREVRFAGRFTTDDPAMDPIGFW